MHLPAKRFYLPLSALLRLVILLSGTFRGCVSHYGLIPSEFFQKHGFVELEHSEVLLLLDSELFNFLQMLDLKFALVS